MQTVRVGRNDLCPCGSGRKFKRCCQNQSAGGGTGRIAAFEKARPVFGDGAGLGRRSPQPAIRREEHDGRPIERIPVHYMYAEPFGQAECVYCFPVDQSIILDNGSVIPARWLRAGMLFRMEDGTLGTVTAVEPPKVWEPPSRTPDRHGNYARRVLGTIKHKGFAVLDVTFGGQTVTTSPDHLFWSASREAWVPVGSMRPGELLRSIEGAVTRVEAISPPRHGFIELYNLEVEELHTYFVGASGPGSALVHNGQGNYIKKPMGLEQAHPDLPVRTSGPTQGLINGKPVVSGTNGGLAQEVFGPRIASLSDEARIAMTHVEGHGAAEMVKNQLSEAVLFINYASGPCKFCRAGVAELLGAGQKLWVVFPRGIGFFTNQGWTRL